MHIQPVQFQGLFHRGSLMHDLCVEMPKDMLAVAREFPGEMKDMYKDARHDHPVGARIFLAGFLGLLAGGGWLAVKHPAEFAQAMQEMMDPNNPTGLTSPISPNNPNGLTNPMSPNNPNSPNYIFRQK